MPRFNRASLLKAAVLLSIMTAPLAMRADEFTGTPGNEPKDLMPYCPPTAPSQPEAGDISFVQMPVWASGVYLSALPDVLKPMGKRTIIAAAKKPTPNPLEPPKDPATIESTTAGGTATAKPANAAQSTAMIAVSPFLQWVQANPQAAAAMARQQANGYQNPAAPTTATGTAPTASTTAPNGAPAPTAGDQTPYWLPPLIDSSSITTAPVRGSAAIYTQPQR